MNQVWKFELKFNKKTPRIASIQLPLSAKFLCVKAVKSGYFAWFLVDAKGPKRRIEEFAVVGTGPGFGTERVAGWEYVLTDVEDFSGLVWHIFRKA